MCMQIYGDKDMDGFYMSKVGSRRGLVPSNMVTEVQVDDPDIAAQLLRESGSARGQSYGQVGQRVRSSVAQDGSCGTSNRAASRSTSSNAQQTSGCRKFLLVACDIRSILISLSLLPLNYNI